MNHLQFTLQLTVIIDFSISTELEECHLSNDIRALEARAFRAWPALETRNERGWIQRLAGGYTKRANSINALEPKDALTDELREQPRSPLSGGRSAADLAADPSRPGRR